MNQYEFSILALSAFLKEELQNNGNNFHESIPIKLLTNGCTLEEDNEHSEISETIFNHGLFPESMHQDHKTIFFNIEKENIKAESIKLLNCLKIDHKDLAEIILSAAPALEGGGISLVCAVLLLILNFRKQSIYTFSPIEAQALYAIYHQPNKQIFTLQQIKEKYFELFKKSLSKERIIESMNLFVNIDILDQLKPNTFKLKEKMAYRRN